MRSRRAAACRSRGASRARARPVPARARLRGGAGPPRAGRTLARRLTLRFVASDHEIEARCGVKIPVIFEIEGAAGFRAREAQAVAGLTQLDGIVLATGGGVALAAENRRLLAA